MATRRFRKRNWVAFMIVNILKLDKANELLYMVHGNLDITMVYRSRVHLNNITHIKISAK